MNQLSEASEKQFWESARQGDQNAFRVLFNHYFHYLIQVGYRYVQREDLAKDFAQEAFLELWKRRTNLDIHTSVKAYLRRAVVNRALNHLKADKKLESLGQDDESMHTGTTKGIQEILEKKEEYQQLYQAIEKLPDRCRIIFVLSRFEELSHKEIAAKLEISPKTIENQITRAFKLLRKSVRRISIF